METLKRTLDGMAAVKMNVLHWHLTEDQGFRVESKKYPKLHQLGSDGNYYTQEQMCRIMEQSGFRCISRKSLFFGSVMLLAVEKIGGKA